MYQRQIHEIRIIIFFKFLDSVTMTRAENELREKRWSLEISNFLYFASIVAR